MFAKRSIGLFLSKGEFVILLASDDMLYGNTISGRVDILQKHPEKKALISNARVIDENSQCISEDSFYYHKGNWENYRDTNSQLRTILFGHWAFIGPVLLLKKEIYTELGLYRSDLHAEDLYFFLKIISHDYFLFSTNIVAQYRIHSSSLSHSVGNVLKLQITKMKTYIYVLSSFGYTQKRYLVLAFCKMFFKLLISIAKLSIKNCITFFVKFFSYNWFTKIHNVFFYKTTMISFGRKSIVFKPLLITPRKISIGRGVSIQAGCRIEGVSLYSNVKFDPKIEINDGVSIQQNLHLTCASHIVISKNTAIAANVTITDIDHPYTDIDLPIAKQAIRVNPVIIGEDGHICNNAVILSGTSIGKHCVVGANSVVKGIFPDYCIIAGAPARIVKRYNFEKKSWDKTNVAGDFI